MLCPTMHEDPSGQGFRQPGEWTPHVACWLAFPSDPALWPDLAASQASFARLCHAIAAPAAGVTGERLEILVRDEAAERVARELLGACAARFHRFQFGDIWMRDIAPVFLKHADGRVGSVRFRFNGWGEKYCYPGDERVAEHVQGLRAQPAFRSALTMEGGGVECDGAGLCLTTREVALNPNRNPGLSEADVERALRTALGAERVVWLNRGLANDHTDGHIDNIARCIAPGRVVCMRSADADDPNRGVLAEIASELSGQGLAVEQIPSPGLVRGREGQPLPASYLNFYIANHSVAVPTFESRYDDSALRAMEALFPGRTVLGVPSKVWLEEGGTVHCISQQEPQEG